MRTARTIAETHDGKEVIVSGRTVPIHEQRKSYFDFKVKGSHPTYAVIYFQESDQPEYPPVRLIQEFKGKRKE